MGFGAFVFCVKFYRAYRASVSLVVFMRVTYRVKGLLIAFSAFVKFGLCKVSYCWCFPGHGSIDVCKLWAHVVRNLLPEVWGFLTSPDYGSIR